MKKYIITKDWLEWRGLELFSSTKYDYVLYFEDWKEILLKKDGVLLILNNKEWFDKFWIHKPLPVYLHACALAMDKI